MSQTRRLAAILAADVAGYLQLDGTLAALKALLHKIDDSSIKRDAGR